MLLVLEELYLLYPYAIHFMVATHNILKILCVTVSLKGGEIKLFSVPEIILTLISLYLATAVQSTVLVLVPHVCMHAI